MSTPRVLVYLLRRDLRLSDNPIFHDISKSFSQSHQPYTHLLPVYVFAAQQIEVSGFLSSSSSKEIRSPFPEARSNVAGFWRCGPHRAKFLAETVWDLEKKLRDIGSGLEIRVGMVGQVVKELLKGLKEQGADIEGVWMTSEEGVEEKREERDVKAATEGIGAKFQLWTDEKYYIDDRDLPFQRPHQLPDVFTTYRKQNEPLRDAPRQVLPTPSKLPPLPPNIPPQPAPFTIPSTLEATITALHKPLNLPTLSLTHPPQWPKSTTTAHPFPGGETSAHARLTHLITSGTATTYKDTRNGTLGPDFSTKLSAFLALGSLTARQVHTALLAFEDATTPLGKGTPGYGKGESKGTAAIRFELLWRDYFRLTVRKFGPRLFRLGGFKADAHTPWKSPSKSPDVQRAVARWTEGRTGSGFIDASMRELFLTGYTSNRLRQNAACFLAKHMGVDWRVGAEWYECMLADYDLASNWGNWQYVAGVGNDPREGRVFNPVKQGWDYDGRGEYVKAWVEEVRGVEDVGVVLQPWKMGEGERRGVGVREGDEWLEEPLVRIEYRGGGGGRGGGGKYGGSSGRGKGGGGGGGGFNGRGRGGGRGGRGQGRRGLVDRERAREEVGISMP